MSVFRRDEKHREKLVDEIADGFNRSLGRTKPEDDKPEPPKFRITGDRREPERRRRDR
ncbi:hypothetical protein [Amycolatopsis suaedae]|uniref:hypothetical protein n=1 Tax=Amycolatopsis suaedae TaxID=2510978 RepID=UPI0013EF52D7|nr:hypothetical protein [Amycolatopsis suaedae]